MFITWATMHWSLAILLLLISVTTALHALLHKRDSRSALLWIIICLFLPVAGPFLYLVFGINRAYRKVQKLSAVAETSLSENPEITSHKKLDDHHSALQLLGSNLTGLPVTDGNLVEILVDGEEAFPAMLGVIQQARHWIYLSTYIFEHKGIGDEFINSLSDAVKRGVDVRVLLDGVGSWYSRGKTKKLLIKEGVNVVSFISPKFFLPWVSINLRNHRKILLVDGQHGFTGGMNIRQCHLINTTKSSRATKDFMFRLQGPILKQIYQSFRDDWFYASGQKLVIQQLDESRSGTCQCRAITDGPGIHLDRLSKILIGAINNARTTITIVSPYFLPPQEITAAIQSAALRGVKVTLLLPERNNLPYVKWAMQNNLWQLLQYDVSVYYQPPPFDHSKLLIIDDQYCQIGSANMDFRSLRLNFELVVEIYDQEFGKKLSDCIEQYQHNAHKLTLAQLQNRPILIKIRDAFCWLFTPYL